MKNRAYKYTEKVLRESEGFLPLLEDNITSKLYNAFLDSKACMHYYANTYHKKHFNNALLDWLSVMEPTELEMYFNSHEIIELLLPYE